MKNCNITVLLTCAAAKYLTESPVHTNKVYDTGNV